MGTRHTRATGGTYREGLELRVQLPDVLVQAAVVHGERAHVLQGDTRRVQVCVCGSKSTQRACVCVCVCVCVCSSAQRVTVPSSLPGASPIPRRPNSSWGGSWREGGALPRRPAAV